MKIPTLYAQDLVLMETDGTQPAVPDLLSCLTKRKGEGYLIFCCCNPNFHQIRIMIVISHLTL